MDHFLGSMEMSKKKHHSAEEIIRKLRQADVLLHEGKQMAEVCRTLGIVDSTYYKWRSEFGGMKVDQAKRLRDLERENGRLKRVVADLTLDKLVLQDAASGKF
jgi:putative transposase